MEKYLRTAMWVVFFLLLAVVFFLHSSFLWQLFSLGLIYIASVCLHEWGHAIATKFLGGRVDYIQLGERTDHWKPFQFRFAGFRWELHSFPSCGMAHVHVDTFDHYRLKQCLLTAAGPLVNILLFVLCWQWREQVVESPVLREMLAVGMIVNGVLAFFSLIPYYTSFEMRKIPNDGQRILIVLRHTDREIHSLAEWTKTNRLFSSGEEAGMTREELLTRHREQPQDISCLWHLLVGMVQTNDTLAGEYAAKFVDHPACTNQQKAIALDLHLTCQLLKDAPPDPERADHLSRELLKLEDTPSTRGTRGSVLIDIGQIDEGKRLLHDVLQHTASTNDMVFSHVFLALAEVQQNNWESAQEQARLARKTDPQHAALKRISDLLPAEAQ